MRYKILGSPAPLPTPVEDPLYRAAFAYRVQGVLEAGAPATLIEIYAQRQTLYPYAERACRLLMECYLLAHQRLGLDHPLRYNRLLRVFLMTEGKAGAEQQQNLIYLYDLSERVPPHEWVRELTHEYGHWIIPPINSFVEPEPWANGDLGERWFTYYLVENVRQATASPTGRQGERFLASLGMTTAWGDDPVVMPSEARNLKASPDVLMGASLASLESYLSRTAAPLVERMAREGLNPQRWRSRRRDGYEEYLALALYIDRVYGSRRLGRAMLCAGGVEPDDFLRGVRESLTEPETLSAELPFPNAYLFLPGGATRWRIVEPRDAKLAPDPKRPEWARCAAVKLQLRRR